MRLVREAMVINLRESQKLEQGVVEDEEILWGAVFVEIRTGRKVVKQEGKGFVFV